MLIRTTVLSLSAFALLSACGNSAPKSAAEAAPTTPAPSAAAATPDRKVVKAMVAKMGELADILETVKDKESARAATKNIAVLAKDMETLARKVDGNNTSTKVSAVMEANNKDFRAIQSRLVTQIARLALTKPELMEIVAEEMDKLDF